MAAQYFAVLKTVDSMQLGEVFKGKRNLLETLRDALQGVLEAIRKGLLKLAVRDRSVYEALKSSADTMEKLLARVDAALEQTQQARAKEIADRGEVVRAEAWEGAESGVETMQSLRIIPEKSEMQENIVTVANMDIVATMTGNVFAKGPIDLITQVSDYFDSIGNLVSNEYGDFVLDKDGAKASLSHGMGRTKAIAYAAVPAVLQNGKIIDYQKNWKGRNYDTAVFSAPVEIAGEKYYEAVVVRVFPDSNKYYLHEVLIEKEGAEGLFKTGTQGKNPAPSNPTAPIFSLLQQIRNVNSNLSSPAAGSQEGNGKAHSLRADAEYMDAVERGDMDEAQKMVDEAAKAAGYDTPRLYHGTGAFGFTEFDLDKGEHAIFASSNLEVAKTYVGETDRMQIAQRSTENIDTLKGKELLEKAQKQFPGEYDGYYLVSEREKNDDAITARSKISFAKFSEIGDCYYDEF